MPLKINKKCILQEKKNLNIDVNTKEPRIADPWLRLGTMPKL